MIKLQDFARDCGVTDRAIQKHLKKHEKELEGHFHRRGPNGTWLDETAQEYIRSLMKQQPVVVGDAAQYARTRDLEKKVEDLQGKLIQAQERLIGYQELLAEHQTTLLALEAATKDNAILEGFIKDAKAEIQALNVEKAAELQQAQDALEQMRQEAFQRLQEAELATQRELAVQKRAESAEAELAAYKALPWYKKIFK